MYCVYEESGSSLLIESTNSMVCRNECGWSEAVLLLTLGVHVHSEGYSSCCVCMCVCPLITAASHIGITQQRYLRVHSNTAIVLNFANFPKNASFKSYGVICLPRAAPPS